MPMPCSRAIRSAALGRPSTRTPATIFGVLLSYLVFLKLVDWRIAFGAALFLALGTSTWSISGNALWTHGLTHLFLAMGLLLLASERPIAAGASFGFGVFVRPQTAMVELVMGVSRGITNRSIVDVLRVGVPTAVGMAAVALYSWANFGTMLPTSGYSSAAVDKLGDPTRRQLMTDIWGTLFDPHGVDSSSTPRFSSCSSRVWDVLGGSHRPGGDRPRSQGLPISCFSCN